MEGSLEPNFLLVFGEGVGHSKVGFRCLSDPLVIHSFPRPDGTMPGSCHTRDALTTLPDPGGGERPCASRDEPGQAWALAPAHLLILLGTDPLLWGHSKTFLLEHPRRVWPACLPCQTVQSAGREPATGASHLGFSSLLAGSPGLCFC